jgi:hypothetical protein
MKHRRHRSCTRKRPFRTLFYALSFLDYLHTQGMGSGLEAYECVDFCGEFHLGHPNG